YAPYVSWLSPLLNLRNRLPFLARLGEKYLGLSAQRQLPEWAAHPYRGVELQSPHPNPPPLAGEGVHGAAAGAPPKFPPPQRGGGAPQNVPPPQAGEGQGGGSPSSDLREIILLVDTFNRYFEPENARAAERVLTRAGYRVITPESDGGRPLCCGRTFLTAGKVD